MSDYDQLILGGGPGGLALAYQLKAAGKTVAVVEENLWGGTCPNRGCDPKKILVAAVEAKRQAAHMQGEGIDGVTTINWADLMRNKFAYTDAIPDGTLGGLKQAHIAALSGHAQFNEDGSVTVGDQIVTADQVILATGQRPSRLDIDGGDLLQTSTDFLNMRELPEKMTFIGGGYIAFELADIANAAGSEVHVILHNDKPLKAFDRELADDLVQQLRDAGVQFDMNVDVTHVVKSADGLTLSNDDGFELETGAVIGATGRIANVDTLNLAAVGVQADAKGVVVNDHLQTTNPLIYAIGDVVAKKGVPKLTPVAGFDARYLADELLGKADAPISYPAIPTVIFGVPRLATTGISTVAAAADDNLRVRTIDMTHWYTYNRIHDPEAKVKAVLNQAGELVGASVLSSVADEMINYMTFLINDHATAKTLNDMVLAYPTPASDLGYIY